MVSASQRAWWVGAGIPTMLSQQGGLVAAKAGPGGARHGQGAMHRVRELQSRRGCGLHEPHVEGGVAEKTGRASTKATNALIDSANGRPSRSESSWAISVSLMIVEGTGRPARTTIKNSASMAPAAMTRTAAN